MNKPKLVNPLNDAESGASLEPFPPDYEPDVVEIFDQEGLLAGMVTGVVVYESVREQKYRPQYIAWYFDGELGLFYMGKNILINRMKLMTKRFER